MARVTTVKSARKDQPTACVRCHKKIVVGQGYRWVANRIGRSSITKRIHVECGSFKRSEITTSEKLGMVYDAQDNAHNEVTAWPNDGNIDDLEAILQQARDTAEEVQGMYEESLSNMPEGLQQGDTGQQIQEKIDMLDSWISELESVSLEGFDEEEFEITDASDEADLERQKQALAEDREQWAEQQRDEARGALDSLEM
jgi:hypothetical protein